MGVRFGEKEWKDTLDQWIGAHEREVQAILASYRVPLLDAHGDADRSARDRRPHYLLAVKTKAAQFD